MEYSHLVQKVLNVIEPDVNNWQKWTEQKSLEPISQSLCMQSFVSQIKSIKANKEKVFIGGDYDCDGIMATTIMVLGLKAYGIPTGFYIPDRIREGYGLNPDTVELVSRKGYSTIITVDNGVKSFDALHKAKQLGLKTIVTDHHQIEQEVPCDLLVHPSLMEEPFSSLCGAGIAYECMRALGADSTYMLELAAVASVGDMMQVTGQTRALIQQGLKALNMDHERHLMPLAQDRNINEVSVGFQIVPKLNAIGRLSNLANVNNVVRYFLSDDQDYIFRLRTQICEINKRRKQMSAQMVKAAKEKVRLQDDILLVMDSGFHEGIIGLAAGNLCATYQKPSIVITKNQEGYKGSMRSPSGFDCMSFFKGFNDFATFGGHAQAVGFSLNLQDYDAFRQYVRMQGQVFQWKPAAKKTLVVNAKELDATEIESLDLLRPFGPGFEMPLLELIDPPIVSMFSFQNGRHCKYTLTTGMQCMHFNQNDYDRFQSVNRIFSFVGSVQTSMYRGRKQVTFIIDEIHYK